MRLVVEQFVANITRVRLFTCVYACVCDQVGLAAKTLFAESARVSFVDVFVVLSGGLGLLGAAVVIVDARVPGQVSGEEKLKLVDFVT